jgi:hypothetical protein
MCKLKCVEHNRRVHVWDDGQGALTVHRSDGTRCVVNPLVTINGKIRSASYITNKEGLITFDIPDFPYMLPDC